MLFWVISSLLRFLANFLALVKELAKKIVKVVIITDNKRAANGHEGSDTR